MQAPAKRTMAGHEPRHLGPHLDEALHYHQAGAVLKRNRHSTVVFVHCALSIDGLCL